MKMNHRQSVAALSSLVLIQSIMLFALYAGVEPHPPSTTPLFGMAPFLGASISIAFAAIVIGPGANNLGSSLSLLAAFLALVSFGPQKYLDASIGLIWPAVMLGQICFLVIVFQATNAIRKSLRRRAVMSSDAKPI